MVKRNMISRRKMAALSRKRKLQREWRVVKYYLEHKDDPKFSMYKMADVFNQYEYTLDRTWVAKVTLKWGVREKDNSKAHNTGKPRDDIPDYLWNSFLMWEWRIG